jgi:N-methylhydantoinase A
MMEAASASWRIGVDVGGTFTDLVLVGPDRGVRVFKVPSVPADPSQGVLNALQRAADSEDLPVGRLLASCSLFVHGSTVATNTVLEGKGARVAMLTTAGFRDSLDIRRGARDDPWDHRTPYPPVLVPRQLRLPVRGRIDRTGQESEPLSDEDIGTALKVFREQGVEAIAICLFNSFSNAGHENAAAEAMKDFPGGFISVSSEIAPIIGEYERSSTAVLNAYVAPRTLSYLRSLNARLGELGLSSPMLLIQSNGGVVSVSELGDRPVTLLLSGPAAGRGALQFFSEAIGSADLVSMEIGGTSCDVILMSGGEVGFTDLLDIGGYKCASPAIEVHTIGAGGGTIARVDAAGLLQVGPKGAGAYPGPACYGLGGRDPTITDAHVVLGRLKAGPYANGAVTIDGDLAARAIEEAVAMPLGLPLERAAAGMIQLMEQKLLHAVQRVSSERGHDPRRLTLVAAGGAGPLHAVAVARPLGSPRAYVPRLSGAFCALGMLHADVRHDYVRVFFDKLDSAEVEKAETVFRQLERQAKATLAREGFAATDVRILRALDLRYIAQQWDITVLADTAFDRAAIRRDFEREHERLFGHIQPGGSIEITKLRVQAFGHIQRLEKVDAKRATGEAESIERRRVWIDAVTGWAETPVYDGASLYAGNVIVGPAVINEMTTTLLVGRNDRMLVDASGNYSIEISR